LAKAIDNQAFIVVANAKEVFGEGFKVWKIFMFLFVFLRFYTLKNEDFIKEDEILIKH
jgi:hypothetical protein